MNKQHHLFVQSIMSRKLLNRKQFNELYKWCLEQNDALREGYDKADAIQTFMSTIREALKDLDFDIRKVFDEISGDSYYVWIVTREREWVKDNAFYSPDQAEFFKALLGELVTSDRGYLKSTAALNLTNSMDSAQVSKSDAESYMKLFEKHGWLIMKDGKIYLGVSALAEFEQYIKDNFQDLVYTCDQCQRIVIYGIHCGNCDNRFHRYCLKRFFTNVKKHECPKCQSNLSVS